MNNFEYYGSHLIALCQLIHDANYHGDCEHCPAINLCKKPHYHGRGKCYLALMDWLNSEYEGNDVQD